MRISNIFKFPEISALMSSAAASVRHAVGNVAGSFASTPPDDRPYQASQRALLLTSEMARAAAEAMAGDVKWMAQLRPIFDSGAHPEATPEQQFTKTLEVVRAYLPKNREPAALHGYVQKRDASGYVDHYACQRVLDRPGSLQEKIAHAVVARMRKSGAIEFSIPKAKTPTRLDDMLHDERQRKEWATLKQAGWRCKIADQDVMVNAGLKFFRLRASSDKATVDAVLAAALEAGRDVRRPNAARSLLAKRQGKSYPGKLPTNSTDVTRMNGCVLIPGTGDMAVCRHLSTLLLDLSLGHSKLQLSAFSDMASMMSCLPKNIEARTDAFRMSSPEVHLVDNDRFLEQLAGQFENMVRFEKMEEDGRTVFVKRFAWRTFDHQMTLQLKYKPGDDKPYAIEVSDPNHSNVAMQTRVESLAALRDRKVQDLPLDIACDYWQKDPGNMLFYHGAPGDMTATAGNRRLTGRLAEMRPGTLYMIVRFGFDLDLMDYLDQARCKEDVLRFLSDATTLPDPAVVVMATYGHASMIDVTGAAMERIQRSDGSLSAEDVMSVYGARYRGDVSAMHLACRHGHADVITSIFTALANLKHAGVNIEARHIMQLFGADKRGRSPLASAAKHGHAEAIKKAIDAGLVLLKKAGIEMSETSPR